MKSFVSDGKNIRQHIEQENVQPPFTQYLREIVYGGLDGIVSTFAVVAGFTGAHIGENVLSYSFLTVLLFGLANLFADSTSMALGNFLSIRAEKDIFRKRKKVEWRQIKEKSPHEQQETEYILQKKGFSEAQARELTAIFKENPRYWLEWMMQHELQLPNVEGTKPLYTAAATFFSFLVFGLLPLIPFMLLGDNLGFTFLLSVGFMLIAFVLLGILRFKVIGDSLIRSLAEIVLTGTAAAVIAFLVGFVFKSL